MVHCISFIQCTSHDCSVSNQNFLVTSYIIRIVPCYSIIQEFIGIRGESSEMIIDYLLLRYVNGIVIGFRQLSVIPYMMCSNLISPPAFLSLHFLLMGTYSIVFRSFIIQCSTVHNGKKKLLKHQLSRAFFFSIENTISNSKVR